MTLRVNSIIRAHGQEPTAFWNEWAAVNGAAFEAPNQFTRARLVEMQEEAAGGEWAWLRGNVTARMVKDWLGY